MGGDLMPPSGGHEISADALPGGAGRTVPFSPVHCWFGLVCATMCLYTQVRRHRSWGSKRLRRVNVCGLLLVYYISLRLNLLHRTRPVHATTPTYIHDRHVRGLRCTSWPIIKLASYVTVSPRKPGRGKSETQVDRQELTGTGSFSHTGIFL